MRHIIIFSTAPSEKEAAKIAKVLVGKKLVACVNIIPKLRSIYRWKGKVFDEPEVLMIMKTRTKNYSKVESAIRKMHSYDCPEVVRISIAGGANKYLGWITKNTL